MERQAQRNPSNLVAYAKVLIPDFGEKPKEYKYEEMTTYPLRFIRLSATAEPIVAVRHSVFGPKKDMRGCPAV